MNKAEKTQTYIDKLEAIEDKPGYKLHEDNVEVIKPVPGQYKIWFTEEVFSKPMFINQSLERLNRVLPDKPPLIKTTIMTFVEYAYYKSRGCIKLNRFLGKRIQISKLMPVGGE
jgi:hypothetical protein